MEPRMKDSRGHLSEELLTNSLLRVRSSDTSLTTLKPISQTSFSASQGKKIEDFHWYTLYIWAERDIVIMVVTRTIRNLCNMSKWCLICLRSQTPSSADFHKLIVQILWVLVSLRVVTKQLSHPWSSRRCSTVYLNEHTVREKKL